MNKNPVIEVIFMSDSTAVLLGGAVDGLFLASVLNCGPVCKVSSQHDHVMLKCELSRHCLKCSVIS